MPESETQYLSIKNWQKYQPKLKNGKDRRDWIRLDTNLEEDPAFLRLTFFQRSLLIGIWRLKGRTGLNPPADAKHIARALQVEGETRHNLGRAIGVLCASGFLILCNQQNEIEYALQDKTGQDKTGQSNISSADKPPRKPVLSKIPPVIFFVGIKLVIEKKSHDSFLVAYEGLDLMAEYRLMDAWLVSNRRNYRNFGRFANSWLGRARIPSNGNSPRHERTIGAHWTEEELNAEVPISKLV